MTDFITLIIISSMWIMGFHVLFRSGFLLSRAGDYMDTHWSLWINKPLWRCPPCMASVHGTLIFFTLPEQGLLLWVFFIVCLAGFNYFLTQFFNS
jgi:hypothetical protein